MQPPIVTIVTWIRLNVALDVSVPASSAGKVWEEPRWCEVYLDVSPVPKIVLQTRLSHKKNHTHTHIHTQMVCVCVNFCTFTIVCCIKKSIPFLINHTLTVKLRITKNGDCALQFPDIHPFIHRWRCQPCKVTTNTSGSVRVRWCLAQGHLARQSPGIEPATFLLPDNRSYTSWATAAPCITFLESWCVEETDETRSIQCLVTQGSK